MKELPATPGSYAVGFRLDNGKVLTVGSLGECCFSAGNYLYFGSALGPGGIRARLKHHYLPKKKRYWHIDYLLDTESITDAWYLAGWYPRECIWATILNQKHNFPSPVNGFGSSDCRAGCSSHLVQLPVGCENLVIGRLLASISCSDVTCFAKEDFESEFR